MRLILFSLLSMILSLSLAEAQSVMDNLPQSVPQAPLSGPNPSKATAAVTAPATPASATAGAAPAATASTDPYTLTDISADVTADTASHARDQALTQAEHTAYEQLCARLSVPDSAAKVSDDSVASLVQSFDVQSEKLSAVRYIGVFTIHFKPAAITKKLGHLIGGLPDSAYGVPYDEVAHNAALAAASHLTVAVQTPSLSAWTQTKRRLTAISQVVSVDTLDLGRSVSHIDLRYTGSLEELQGTLTAQGLILHQAIDGEWALADTAVQ